MLKRNIASTVFWLAFVFFKPVSLYAKVIYVDASIIGPSTGASWTTAFKQIKAALSAASFDDSIAVKSGTYERIVMVEGVKIFGGFSNTALNFAERDWINNETIIDGNGIEENVVIGANNGKLDGFTITGGNADELCPPGLSGCGGGASTTPSCIMACAGFGNGGGILCNKTAPTIENCKITKNYALKGGGIYAVNASPVFINCIISENSSLVRGGGVSHDLFSNPTYEKCQFINNSCDEGKGGGIYNDFGCNPQFTNCLIAENFAVTGAGIAIDGSSNPVLTHCTIANNHAIDIGAGIYTGSYNTVSGTPNEPKIFNCIIWGNATDWGGPQDLCIWHLDHFIIEYSLIGNGFVSHGPGVITLADPLFSSSSNYHLKVGSPCINRGGPTMTIDDLDGKIRDVMPDIGAYEY